MKPGSSTADVAATLARVTAGLAGREERPGQVRMAELVADAIRSKTHLVVQAGTGTGKSLGYLVPAVLAGKRVVVATATKALQDQLASKDLPFLQRQVDVPFTWAMLKGRSNYVCLQRVREVTQSSQGQLELDDLAPTMRVEVKRLAEW
ncbi:MAG TPA: ATP-dependent helicase, partial [Ilumatobacteraceae bacterium]|nr:ATP-dependent helicase [Ilumatobacteraceae bacterium]